MGTLASSSNRFRRGSLSFEERDDHVRFLRTLGLRIEGVSINGREHVASDTGKQDVALAGPDGPFEIVVRFCFFQGPG